MLLSVLDDDVITEDCTLVVARVAEDLVCRLKVDSDDAGLVVSLYSKRAVFAATIIQVSKCTHRATTLASSLFYSVWIFIS
jgi:hypothetical protein